jgi:lipoprotein-anchoring transpeptidase ErfK/SrfK
MITDPLSMPLSRRVLLASALSCALPATARAALPQNIGDDPFPLKPFDYSLLPPDYRRKVIPYSGRHRPGTVIVDTAARQLYFILGNGKAIRFGCAVGRDGFRWAGVADVGRKVMWPRWTPPEEMIRRSPEKAKWKNGMPGGPENPLGARALYLFQNLVA